MMHHAAAVTAYIGIGGNLGDARETVVAALRQLRQIPQTTVAAVSSLYRSAPLESSGDDYVNAVAQLHTTLAPHALLSALHAIEHEHGRLRPYRNAPRTLDLDILLYGEQRIDDQTLTVPHPRMTQRAFVLIPLLEIAPAVMIPGSGAAHSLRAAVAAQAIEMIGAAPST